MEFSVFEEYFSASRVERYRVAVGDSKVNDFIKREVEKAENRILKTNSKITSGKIIAEQSLGFWTDFFEVHNYKLLKGKPIQIFKYLPSGYGRKEVNELLNNIRRFRNRINHNEPICFKEDNIDFSNTILVYNSIIKILSWINPDIISFISDIDTVIKNIKQTEKLK